MKRIVVVILSLAVLFLIFFASCKNGKKERVVNTAPDTAGFSQKIIDSIAAESEMSKADAANKTDAPDKLPSRRN